MQQPSASEPTADTLDDWLALAFEELDAKQAALEADYGLGRWPQWNADLAHGALMFSNDQGVQVEATVQIAGTVAADTWMWAWANASLPAQHVVASERMRACGERNGLDIFTAAKLAADDADGLGWQMAAAVAKLTRALGVYRAPTKTGAIFLVIESIASVGRA